MRQIADTCRVALVQAEPVMFDAAAGLRKTLRYLEEAASAGAELIVFPELFIPGYPIGMNFGFSMGKRSEKGRRDWKRYYDASLVAGGPELESLAAAAKERKVYLSVGFSERDAVSGTLYNSNALIRPDGTCQIHRKLKPTGSERLVWGDANRDYFPVMDTPWGPAGSLICWESYMPLARVALYNKGVTLYISPNTNDNPEWQATIRHIAIEGKCFFLNSDMLVRKSSYPRDLSQAPGRSVAGPRAHRRGKGAHHRARLRPALRRAPAAAHAAEQRRDSARPHDPARRHPGRLHDHRGRGKRRAAVSVIIRKSRDERHGFFVFCTQKKRWHSDRRYRIMEAPTETRRMRT